MLLPGASFTYREHGLQISKRESLSLIWRVRRSEVRACSRIQTKSGRGKLSTETRARLKSDDPDMRFGEQADVPASSPMTKSKVFVAPLIVLLVAGALYA